MMKIIFGILIFFLILGSPYADSVWTGNALAGEVSDFPSNSNDYRAASNSFPPGTRLKVTNPRNGKETTVRVVRRLEKPGVFILLEKNAAQMLGLPLGQVLPIRLSPHRETVFRSADQVKKPTPLSPTESRDSSFEPSNDTVDKTETIFKNAAFLSASPTEPMVLENLSPIREESIRISPPPREFLFSTNDSDYNPTVGLNFDDSDKAIAEEEKSNIFPETNPPLDFNESAVMPPEGSSRFELADNNVNPEEYRASTAQLLDVTAGNNVLLIPPNEETEIPLVALTEFKQEPLISPKEETEIPLEVIKEVSKEKILVLPKTENKINFDSMTDNNNELLTWTDDEDVKILELPQDYHLIQQSNSTKVSDLALAPDEEKEKDLLPKPPTTVSSTQTFEFDDKETFPTSNHILPDPLIGIDLNDDDRIKKTLSNDFLVASELEDQTPLLWLAENSFSDKEEKLTDLIPSSSVGLEELKSSPPVELTELAPSSSPVELEKPRFASSIELEELTPSPPVELTESTPSSSPVELENLRFASSIELEEIAPTPSIEQEEIAPTPSIEQEEIASTPLIEQEEIAPTPLIEQEEIASTPLIEQEEIAPTPLIEQEEIASTPLIEQEEIVPTLQTEIMQASSSLDQEPRIPDPMQKSPPNLYFLTPSDLRPPSTEKSIQHQSPSSASSEDLLPFDPIPQAHFKASEYYIQIGAYYNRHIFEEAAHYVQNLDLGRPLPIVVDHDEKKKIYKLFIGPLRPDERGVVLQAIQATQFSDSFFYNP